MERGDIFRWGNSICKSPRVYKKNRSTVTGVGVQILPGGALKARPGSSELFPKGSGEPRVGFRQERDVISILERCVRFIKMHDQHFKNLHLKEMTAVNSGPRC